MEMKEPSMRDTPVRRISPTVSCTRNRRCGSSGFWRHDKVGNYPEVFADHIISIAYDPSTHPHGFARQAAALHNTPERVKAIRDTRKSRFRHSCASRCHSPSISAGFTLDRSSTCGPDISFRVSIGSATQFRACRAPR